MGRRLREVSLTAGRSPAVRAVWLDRFIIVGAPVLPGTPPICPHRISGRNSIFQRSSNMQSNRASDFYRQSYSALRSPAWGGRTNPGRRMGAIFYRVSIVAFYPLGWLALVSHLPSYLSRPGYAVKFILASPLLGSLSRWGASKRPRNYPGWIGGPRCRCPPCLQSILWTDWRGVALQ